MPLADSASVTALATALYSSHVAGGCRPFRSRISLL